MSDGYQVNTDELEAVVKRLRALQQNIGQTADKTKYNTVVKREDFGGNFPEASALFTAHDGMQAFLAKTIADLNSLINDFGDKTKMVTENYRGLEEDQKSVMNSQQRAV
ncbi:hypothetical protein F4556_004569 [Kitasatospora gansuensis]|uniref:WXG100 family type VII secretion target n=2 Tax=Kitasatospora TaxID=2063 RepID=A0A7W7WJV7_9ACTN|nr:hypothetical protein [Kitasatospora gansuensis]MBB4949034.1 hypothetical protein [Kitasatospora gansuensis]